MPFTFRPLIFTPQARQRALRSLIYSLALSFSIRVTNSQVNICCAHSHLSWKKSRIIIHLKVTTRAQLEQLHRRSCRYYNNIHACSYLGHGGSEETHLVKNKNEQALRDPTSLEISSKWFETLVEWYYKLFFKNSISIIFLTIETLNLIKYEISKHTTPMENRRTNLPDVEW